MSRGAAINQPAVHCHGCDGDLLPPLRMANHRQPRGRNMRKEQSYAFHWHSTRERRPRQRLIAADYYCAAFIRHPVEIVRPPLTFRRQRLLDARRLSEEADMPLAISTLNRADGAARCCATMRRAEVMPRCAPALQARFHK
jgi:hypothetical protein